MPSVTQIVRPPEEEAEHGDARLQRRQRRREHRGRRAIRKEGGRVHNLDDRKVDVQRKRDDARMPALRLAAARDADIDRVLDDVVIRQDAPSGDLEAAAAPMLLLADLPRLQIIRRSGGDLDAHDGGAERFVDIFAGIGAASSEGSVTSSAMQRSMPFNVVACIYFITRQTSPNERPPD